MTMRRYARLEATIERWTGRHGEQRARRVPVGTIFRDDESGRMSARLDLVPVSHDWHGWLAVIRLDQDSDDTPARRSTDTTA